MRSYTLVVKKDNEIKDVIEDINELDVGIFQIYYNSFGFKVIIE